jgi:CDP-glucose 4,6-dehydratase
MFNKAFQNKKVLITGDTGFKGSWLSIWLIELGSEVYGYALPPSGDEDNYVACKLEKKIHHTDGDIRNVKLFNEKVNTIKPDIIFHLAAQPLVVKSYEDPFETYSTNIMGVVNVFEVVRKNPSIKVFINVTSDKCYQNNDWIWGYRENDKMGGKDPYSASKGVSEIITHSYIESFFSKNGTTNIASARAGNVIGAGDWAENRIIPDYFRSLKNKQKLLIRNPDSTRPWQHVLEPLSGYLNLASNLLKGGKMYQGGWNFGPLDSKNYSVYHLINEISKKSNYFNNEIENNITDKPEARLLQLDISKAKSLLHWSPILDFDKTINFTVQGYLSDISENSVFENRIETINKYMKIAKTMKVKWAEK